MYIQAAMALSIFLLIALRQTIEHSINNRPDGVATTAARYRELIRENLNRLNRWQEARPMIYRGHCPYARRLLTEMIEAYEFLLNHKLEVDTHVLLMLKQILEELPPDHDPPHRGGFFLQWIQKATNFEWKIKAP